MVELLTKELLKAYPSLSEDEGSYLAHAYSMGGMGMKFVSGIRISTSDGYFDCTLNFARSKSVVCQGLVERGFLCKHPSNSKMVRISDEIFSKCNQILDRCPTK